MDTNNNMANLVPHNNHFSYSEGLLLQLSYCYQGKLTVNFLRHPSICVVEDNKYDFIDELINNMLTKNSQDDVEFVNISKTNNLPLKNSNLIYNSTPKAILDSISRREEELIMFNEGSIFDDSIPNTSSLRFPLTWVFVDNNISASVLKQIVYDGPRVGIFPVLFFVQRLFYQRRKLMKLFDALYAVKSNGYCMKMFRDY